VLSTDSDAPPVTKTAVGADLLESLDVVTELGINVLGEDLAVLSGLEVLLSVQEPERDLELAWVLDDGDDLLDLIGGQFSCSLVDVDLGLFADEVSETASKTLDLGQSENDISLSFHVCIKNTQNVLEFRSLHQRARPVEAFSISVFVGGAAFALVCTIQIAFQCAVTSPRQRSEHSKGRAVQWLM